MLLRLTIANLYSFKDETSISFVSGKSPRHEMQVLRDNRTDGISTLKAGVIYGANASGKSNIIKAAALLQNIAQGSIPASMVEPFKLADTHTLPSKIEAEFRIEDKFYAYGVDIKRNSIEAEWLYEINRRSDKKIFSRTVSNEGNSYEWGSIQGGGKVKQMLELIGKITPTTDSFLSEYVRRNGEGLPDIKMAFAWFNSCLKVVFPNSHFNNLIVHATKFSTSAEILNSLLNVFNTGIASVRHEKIPKENIELSPKLLDIIYNSVKPNSSAMMPGTDDIYIFESDADCNIQAYKQTTLHKSSKGDYVEFKLSEESDGTLRLLDFIPMLIDLKMNNVVYLIDELDRSMHPLLTQKLLDCYLAKLTKGSRSQLIFTTHESHLLDLGKIRADEVWFVEKDSIGSSHLTSLVEYRCRENIDIRKGYLQGRYGAIPLFASETLNWSEDEN